MRFEEELLKHLDKVEGLTGEQKEAIKIGATDVFQKKTGDLKGLFDKDVLELSGLPKNQGEKTHEYIKRAFDSSKIDVTPYQSEITALKKERDSLVLNGAGDKELKDKVTLLETKISDSETLLNDWKTKYETSEKTLEEKAVELRQSKVRSMMYGDDSISFNETIPETLRKMTVKTIDDRILSIETDEIDDGKGGKLTVFRKDGEILRDSENELNPHTAQSLRRSRLKEAGLLAEKRVVNGAGTKPTPVSGNTTELDLSGVKTKVAATAEINAYLMGKGLERNSEAFVTEQTKIYVENKVGELPLR